MVYKTKYFCLLAVFLFFLSGCADSGTAKQKPAADSQLTDQEAPAAVYTYSTADGKSKKVKKTGSQKKAKSQKKKSYKAPGFAGSAFHAELAQGDGNVLLDLSAAKDGYVAIAAWSPARLKFQVTKGESTYTYDIASD